MWKIPTHPLIIHLLRPVQPYHPTTQQAHLFCIWYLASGAGRVPGSRTEYEILKSLGRKYLVLVADIEDSCKGSCKMIVGYVWPAPDHLMWPTFSYTSLVKTMPSTFDTKAFSLCVLDLFDSASHSTSPNHAKVWNASRGWVSTQRRELTRQKATWPSNNLVRNTEFQKAPKQ